MYDRSAAELLSASVFTTALDCLLFLIAGFGGTYVGTGARESP